MSAIRIQEPNVLTKCSSYHPRTREGACEAYNTPGGCPLVHPFQPQWDEAAPVISDPILPSNVAVHQIQRAVTTDKGKTSMAPHALPPSFTWTASDDSAWEERTSLVSRYLILMKEEEAELERLAFFKRLFKATSHPPAKERSIPNTPKTPLTPTESLPTPVYTKPQLPVLEIGPKSAWSDERKRLERRVSQLQQEREEVEQALEKQEENGLVERRRREMQRRNGQVTHHLERDVTRIQSMLAALETRITALDEAKREEEGKREGKRRRLNQQGDAVLVVDTEEDRQAISIPSELEELEARVEALEVYWHLLSHPLQLSTEGEMEESILTDALDEILHSWLEETRLASTAETRPSAVNEHSQRLKQVEEHVSKAEKDLELLDEFLSLAEEDADKELAMLTELASLDVNIADQTVALSSLPLLLPEAQFTLSLDEEHVRKSLVESITKLAVHPALEEHASANQALLSTIRSKYEASLAHIHQTDETAWQAVTAEAHEYIWKGPPPSLGLGDDTKGLNVILDRYRRWKPDYDALVAEPRHGSVSFEALHT